MSLTIDDIRKYLSFKKYCDGVDCSSNKLCSDATDLSSNTIVTADSFLLDENAKNEATLSILNSSFEMKDNFLSLYNDQYEQNMELFIGILLISGVLAKLMFYPIKTI
jgi:hypothetical protein